MVVALSSGWSKHDCNHVQTLRWGLLWRVECAFAYFNWILWWYRHVENNTNKQNANGPSTCWNIPGHLPWTFPCAKMGIEYHLLLYRWWIGTRIKPAVGDAEHLFIINCHDVLIIDRHDFIINIRQVHRIGVVNITSWVDIMSIGQSRRFPLDHDSMAMSTIGKSASKHIGTSHYQNQPGCDQQNSCQLGVYGNRSS